MQTLKLGMILVMVALLIPAIGGTAAASVSCDGHAATIVGTSAHNRIIGTANRDVIASLGGNDVIYGKGGNDLICAGGGKDIIDGQRGSDTVYGGAGTDWCLAPTAAEHKLHFGCEIHLIVPTPTKNPGTKTPTPKVNAGVTTRASRAGLGATTRASRGSFGGSCNGYCTAGMPYCVMPTATSGSIDLAPDASSTPVAAAVDSSGDYVSTIEGIYNMFTDQTTWTDEQVAWVPNDGSFHYVHPNHTFYGPGSLQSSGYYVYDFFAWSSDGQNWGPWYYATPSLYTQNSQGTVVTSAACVNGFL